MTTAAFGWAQPHVRALCEARRRNVSLCLSSDPGTRMYLLLALRGWEKRQPPMMDFEDVADQIAEASRRTFLKVLWGCDLGSPNLLHRCKRSIHTRRQLDVLARCLSQDAARRCLARHPEITPKLLHALASVDAPSVSPQRLELIARFGAVATDYLVTGLKRQDPRLDEQRAECLLLKARNAREIYEPVSYALRDTPLPPPPWLGSTSIHPLRTMRAIRQTGLLFQNCLSDGDFGLRALSGALVIYVAEVDGVPLCASVTRDRILRSWRLSEVLGARNAKPTPKQRRTVVKAFSDAGFPYLAKSPLELWFD